MMIANVGFSMLLHEIVKQYQLQSVILSDPLISDSLELPHPPDASSTALS